MATAGYSGTPLPKKLGLKEGGTLVLLNAPAGIASEFAPLPARQKVQTRSRFSEQVGLFDDVHSHLF